MRIYVRTSEYAIHWGGEVRVGFVSKAEGAQAQPKEWHVLRWKKGAPPPLLLSLKHDARS